MVVVAGVVLFFLDYAYAIPVIISGFLLLSIYTVATINTRPFRLMDFLKVGTILLFVVVAACYILNSVWGYWLLIIAVVLQIIIALTGLFKREP